MCFLTIPLDYYGSGFLFNAFKGIWELICFIALCLFGWWIFRAIDEKNEEKEREKMIKSERDWWEEIAKSDKRLYKDIEEGGK